MIPYPVRIYDRDRPVLADSKTVGLRAVNISAPRKPEFFKPVLQEIPGSQSDLLRATLGLGLVATQKNMTPGLGHTNRLGSAPLTQEPTAVGGLFTHTARKTSRLENPGWRT